MGSFRRALMVMAVLLLTLQVGESTPVTAADDAVATADARTWLGREAEFERLLTAAKVITLEPIGKGVTRPFRASVEPGGPIEAFAWKPITPGYYSRFYESYKSEVAAYELDKFLGLGMVPVKVRREVDGALGAACMWVSPAQTFHELGGAPSPPAEESERWGIQLTRAKMFDNLINNLDPNLGNWMVDPAWNIILIDHSRAFTVGSRMVHDLKRVERGLWERVLELDEDSLVDVLGDWVSKGQIKSILKRRDRMVGIVADLVAEHGEAVAIVEAAD